jgi:hypothetical protein
MGCGLWRLCCWGIITVTDVEQAIVDLVRNAAQSVAADQRGTLVALRDGFGPLSGSTLAAWSRSGRLRAFTAERGRLVAWEADIRAAVEAEPYTPVARRRGAHASGGGDDLLAGGDLEATS